MSLELLYTSAASGLKQGSRGFCTVLSTAGMPINLAMRLESLSGYRHLFAPQDENADKNPIAYSHLRVKVSGRPLSVLSRVSAYGTDYSGRTNKLAHHIVLEPHEHAAAGPAFVLAQPGFARKQWDGKNQTPASGPIIPMQDQSPAICRSWASLTGDAGHGGLLAEVLCGPGSRSAWVVFDVSQSGLLLSLMNESIALLSPADRWQATFSTYYTKLPPEIDCRVRCVLAGSDEARLAASRGTVIDLTRPQPLTLDSPLIGLARSGPSIPAPRVRKTPAPVTAAAVQTESTGSGLELADPFEESGYNLKPLELKPPAVLPSMPKKPGGPPKVNSGKKGMSPLPLVIAAGLLMLLLAGGFGVYGIQKIAVPKVNESIMEMVNGPAGPGSFANASSEKKIDPVPPSVSTDAEIGAGLLEELNEIEGELDSIEKDVSDLHAPDTAVVSESNETQEIDFPEAGLAEIEETTGQIGDHAKDAEASLSKLKAEKTILSKQLLSESKINEYKTSFEEKRTQLEKQKDAAESHAAFLQSLDELDDKLTETCAKLKKVKESLPRDLDVKARCELVDELHEKIKGLIQEKREKFPQGESISDCGTMIAEIDEKTDRLDKAVRSLKKIATRETQLEEAIEKKEKEELAKANTAAQEVKRTIEVTVQVGNDSAKIVTLKPFTLERKKTGNPDSYRWNESDTPVALNWSKPEITIGVADLFGQFTLLDFTAVNQEDKFGTIKLRYQSAGNLSENDKDPVVTKEIIKFLSTLNGFIEDKNKISSWQGYPTGDAATNLASEKSEKQRNKAEETLIDNRNKFDQLHIEIQGLVKKASWHNVTKDNLQEIDVFLERLDPLKSIEAPVFKPTILVRIESLKSLRTKYAQMIESRDKLRQPQSLGSKKLYLTTPAANSSTPGLRSKSGDTLDKIDIEPMIVLKPEEAK